MTARDLFPPSGGSATTRGTRPATGIEAPAELFEAVTPNDDNDLTYLSRALYIGGAGDVGVLDAQGNFALFVGCLAGSILPIRVSRVLVHEPGSPAVTITTATNIVALT